LGQDDPTTGDVGMFAQKQWVLRSPTAGEDRIDPVVMLIQCVDDVAGAVRDRLDRRQVKQCQIVNRIAQRQARDHSPKGWIGAR